MSLFYRIRGQLISKYPWRDGIGGWRMVTHYDCDPSNGGPAYINVWEHSDGRQVQEGPGFCGDPDLELLLFQQQRLEKKEERIRKIGNRLIYWPWLLVLIQGVISFQSFGFWIILSLLGSLCLFVGVNFICCSYPFWQNRKYFYRSLSVLILGILLISIGKFNSLSLGLFDLSLYYFSTIMGLLNSYINR